MLPPARPVYVIAIGHALTQDDAECIQRAVMDVLNQPGQLDDLSHPGRPRRQNIAVIRCGACQHTAPSMTEIAWQPDWKQWRCTDPGACHKRQQEAGMEGNLPWIGTA